MDLNLELMREQIALHGVTRAVTAKCRDHHRGAARTIREGIDRRFGKLGFRPVTA